MRRTRLGNEAVMTAERWEARFRTLVEWKRGYSLSQPGDRYRRCLGLKQQAEQGRSGPCQYAPHGGTAYAQLIQSLPRSARGLLAAL